MVAFAGIQIFSTNTQTPYQQAAKKAADNFMAKSWLQGWQWKIVCSGATGTTAIEDFDLYVKDIDFGAGSIDVDVTQVGTGSIALPTFSSVGEITMTVREDQDHTISNWFDEQIKKVKNTDGTLNLPTDYVFKLSIYTLDDDGKTNEEFASFRVFAVKRGNITFSRENGNQIQSFPIIFQKFSNVGDKAL